MARNLGTDVPFPKKLQRVLDSALPAKIPYEAENRAKHWLIRVRGNAVGIFPKGAPKKAESNRRAMKNLVASMMREWRNAGKR